MGSGTVLDALIAALDSRARQGAVEQAPVAVLWPDEGIQWEPFVVELRERRLVLELGDADSEVLRGSAYWIRGVVDAAIDVPRPDDGAPPIVYLPGYARSDIRAVQEADETLKPLAELQYRGTIFAQQSGRDWTISAFLQSRLGGLGIEVADDSATKEAMLRARTELAAQPLDDIRKRAPLRAPYFDGLLARDIDRDVLRWLEDPVACRESLGPEKWEAFRARFADRFGIGLEEGEVAIAGQLGRRAGAWGGVWQRYVEAPGRYPAVEQRLRDAAPKRVKDAVGMFDGPLGAWPQDNDVAESQLRDSFTAVAALDVATAADSIVSLEREHGERRAWVWAGLGDAPLASASLHLSALAGMTRKQVPAGSVAELVAAYTDDTWRADDAVIRAMAAVTTKADRDAVAAVIGAIYVPWLDMSVRRFQETVGAAPADYSVELLVDWPEGTCVVFIDGLRFDVGRRVEVALSAAGHEVSARPRLTALPTITSTGKPAASPIARDLGPGNGLAPAPRTGGVDLAIAGLRAMLAKAGYQVLQGWDLGDPLGRAWTEHGDIDELGHKQPVKLPQLLDGEVQSLRERVDGLLDAGWQQVVIVTDHGWLYLPGGLPKVELPYYLTKDERMKKGRTGRLADGAVAPGDTVPWFWDPDVRMAVAPGIATFVAGAVYEHGGVSLQECVTPVITARATTAPKGPVTLAVNWRGLRADVNAQGAATGSSIDLRYKAGLPETSLLGTPAPVSEDGSARILVADDDALSRSAFLVLVDEDGRVTAQETVVVGGDG